MKIRIIVDTFADSEDQAATIAADCATGIKAAFSQEVEFVGWQNRRKYRARTEKPEEATSDAS